MKNADHIRTVDHGSGSGSQVVTRPSHDAGDIFCNYLTLPPIRGCAIS